MSESVNNNNENADSSSVHTPNANEERATESTDTGDKQYGNQNSDVEKQDLEQKLENLSNEEELEKNLPTIPEVSLRRHIISIILCFCIAWGGFIFGFDTGTISGFENMTNYIDRFSLEEADGTQKTYKVGLITAIFNAGCAVGCIGLSRLSDILGRRIAMMIGTVIYIVGIIIQISSETNWIQIVFGRLIAGLAIGMISVLSPLFISETSPKRIRGTMVFCFQLCVTFGIFMGYCINYGTSHNFTDSRQWRITLGLCFAWAIFLIVGMVFSPESPRFLIERNKIEKAKRSIASSNSISVEDPAVMTEIRLIQIGLEKEKSAGNASWGQLLTGKPKIFMRVMTGCFLQSLQQLTGNNYFFYYGTYIFKEIGIDDSFQTAIVFGVINFASTFVGIYTIEKFGRRQCLLVGSAGMCVSLFIYSVLGTAGDVSIKPQGKAQIFVSCLFIFFFATSWAGGCFSIVSEIYPLRIRSKGMAVATASNWVWNFLISFFTTSITNKIHFAFGFVFFGCCVFGAFFAYFFVYETKGLSLEEVDQLYASGVPAWKSSSWKPPSAQEVMKEAGREERSYSNEEKSINNDTN